MGLGILNRGEDLELGLGRISRRPLSRQGRKGHLKGLQHKRTFPEKLVRKRVNTRNMEYIKKNSHRRGRSGRQGPDPKKLRLYPQGHGVSLEGFKKGGDMIFLIPLEAVESG